MMQAMGRLNLPISPQVGASVLVPIAGRCSTEKASKCRGLGQQSQQDKEVRIQEFNEYLAKIFS